MDASVIRAVLARGLAALMDAPTDLEGRVAELVRDARLVREQLPQQTELSTCNGAARVVPLLEHLEGVLREASALQRDVLIRSGSSLREAHVLAGRAREKLAAADELRSIRGRLEVNGR